MNKVAEEIALEIKRQGIISFATFMELALYCPVYGYYEKEGDTVGRRGDYCTSVSVGSLFGELLGFQFADWLGGHGHSHVLQLVEAGAHDGTLARDILTWLRQCRPELFSCLEYWIVEPSTRRRKRQEKTLDEFGGTARWASDITELAGSSAATNSSRPTETSRDSATQGIRGIIFANELLDAMPVHRIGWDAKNRVWFEWGVTLNAGQFVWERICPDCRATLSGREACNILEHWPFDVSLELLDVLPDGFTTEVCPAARKWWRQASVALEAGSLVTIDYGLSSEEFFVPERKGGTLRSYRRHRPGNDILTDPGLQDITAHVDFTAVRSVGEAAGLRTEIFATQAQFLTTIAARAWQAPGAFGEWTAHRSREFQTLAHPEHLGRPFRVLMQSNC